MHLLYWQKSRITIFLVPHFLKYYEEFYVILLSKVGSIYSRKYINFNTNSLFLKQNVQKTEENQNPFMLMVPLHLYSIWKNGLVVKM